MRVIFTKVDDKRYTVAIEREHGPALRPRFGPGNDDRMPHDLAHYLVEEYFGIELGVWGQLAAGGGGIFSAAPEDTTLPVRRRARRISAVGREDMARSEELVVITVAAWEQSTGRVKHQTRPVDREVPAETLTGAVRRVSEVADRWHALEHGGSLTFIWPGRLTFDTSKSRRGRRATKERSGPVRR